MEPKTKSYPPPGAAGPVVATAEVMVPAGSEGRPIHAVLKQKGRIVARGQATAGPSGEICPVDLHAPTAGTTLKDDEYTLWLTINHDDWQSWFPSFGDVYLQATWTLHQETRVRRFTDPADWNQRPLTEPANRLVIHYRRYDEVYENIGIWTWDTAHRRTPGLNELFPVGRDEFGLVFELDRGLYGDPAGATEIGLLPRFDGDWHRKDGDDRHWRPEHGDEIYLIGTRNQVWTARPDTSPHTAMAYIESTTRLVVQVSELLEAADVTVDQVRIVDDQDHERVPVSVKLVPRDDRPQSNYLEVILFEPLDVEHRFYRIRVRGFRGEPRAVPRGVLDSGHLYADHEAELGARYATDSTTFRVFAPTAQEANVVLYDAAEGEAGRVVHPLQRTSKGLWEGTVSGDLDGRYYLYQLAGPDLSADREVVDIYAVNTVRSTTRARITNLDKTDPPDWQQFRRGPAVASPTDMVIWEMHVRDFSIAANSGIDHKGKYLGFTEGGTHLPGDPSVKTGLDHLVELGVTHVQLMPIQDFSNDEEASGYNWGYMTDAFNSPEGWFATNPRDESRIREFKQLVKALHQRGIGVIMDVVYNHTGGAAPFNHLVPGYYYRFLPDGSYANGSGCGNDFRSESPMGRKYIIDTLVYWVEEYGIDGFRFDLMALIDAATMKEAEAELQKINPQIIIYGEPWAAAYSPLDGHPTDKYHIRGSDIGAFNDNVRNAWKGSPDGADGGFIQNSSNREVVKHGIEGSWRDWAPSAAHTINYLTCHDNLVLYDKIKLSRPHAPEEEILDTMRLGYLLLFISQGVPFIHGGEEFGRTKNGHHNSYNAPDEINQVDWSLKQKNHDLFTYVRDLIAIRRSHPAFRIRVKEQIAAWLTFHPTPDHHTLMCTIDAAKVTGETWSQICVVVNAADSENMDIGLPPGPWHVALDHHGAIIGERVIEGTVRVRYKSGQILFQP